MSELSFEEFRAVQNRTNKLKNITISEKKGKKGKESGTLKGKDELSQGSDLRKGLSSRDVGGEGDTQTNDTNGKAVSFLGSIGDFLELHQMQTFVIVMIVLDSFVSFAEMCLLKVGDLDSRGTEQGGRKSGFYDLLDSLSKEDNGFVSFLAAPIKTYLVRYMETDFILACLQSFTSFALFFFTLEVSALLVAFGVNVVGHYGYATDSVIVALQLLFELRGNGKETRLLNIFRFWRVARLLNSLVGVEKESHEETKERLQQKDVEMKKIESESRRIAGEFAKEKEARDAIEEMLQSYKNEVETLNEALKIAAMDIAEVAQADDDYFVSDDEDDVDDLGDAESSKMGSASAASGIDRGNVYMDAAASEYDRVKNKVLLREVATEGNNSSTGGGAPTFLIYEDGSFEKK